MWEDLQGYKCTLEERNTAHLLFIHFIGIESYACYFYFFRLTSLQKIEFRLLNRILILYTVSNYIASFFVLLYKQFISTQSLRDLDGVFLLKFDKRDVRKCLELY